MSDAADQAPTSPGDAEASGARALPEIEHAIGPLRQAILDHLLDMADAGPQRRVQMRQPPLRQGD